jgi:peptidyl-prolyl cis-trans isomerase C
MVVNRVRISGFGACFVLFVATGLAGCEKISSVYDHLTKKESAKSAPISVEKSVSPSKNIPAEIPKTKETLPANVVASVGDWSITLDEFNDKLSKLKDILPEFDPADINSKKLILEELVRQELLVKDAEQSGVAQQKEIMDTVEDFRKTLLVQEVATKLTKDIKATEADAQVYYDKNKENFVVKSEWKVREIVLPSESEAKEILVQLLQGGDFVEIAKTKSKSVTANKGGDIGWVAKFPFDQMRAAVIALETGKTSGVFKGPNGYYIVKLEDKRGGAPKPFLAIKADLTKKLSLKKQQEAVLEYLNTLAAKTKIQVNEELLK